MSNILMKKEKAPARAEAARYRRLGVPGVAQEVQVDGVLDR